MRNVHSICEGQLITVTPSKMLPSANTWRIETAETENRTTDDHHRGSREIAENATLLIEPTTTIPAVEMTT